MASERIHFSGHCIRRLFERGITEEEVLTVLASGEVIEEYPEDEPYPSQLILGYAKNTPIHVVVASNEAAHEKVIVTVYVPDLSQWQSDFKTRKVR